MLPFWRLSRDPGLPTGLLATSYDSQKNKTHLRKQGQQEKADGLNSAQAGSSPGLFGFVACSTLQFCHGFF